ncbi:putative glycosidase crf1 [Ceratocystis platani]|uniref:chitinase n=1 Tax=Ceratocystis fimbriata f. sp. platani TaxID=88771 RepID=A0A0F8B547_CERFI|nr:putative glycosidase crf1 [Ceratocystis platani]
MASRYLVALLASIAAAQVTTDCNPMQKSCPNDLALGTTHEWNFTSQPDTSIWKQKVNGVTFDPKLGAKFTVAKQGDAPTLMSNFYFFWGRTEMMLRCASGTGIISSMMWLSDNLDEVDFEFLGTKPNQAASNFFGKGIENFANGGTHDVAFDNQADFHNYTVDWTADYIKWYIDGALIRTLSPNEANSSYTFPQTPMRFYIGIWAGGDPRLPQGTRDWAGGDTDYNGGPYDMYVKSVKITDYSNNSKEYQWSDRSGSSSSIKIIGGTSSVATELNKAPEKSLSEKFNDLSPGAKAGIFGGASFIGVAVVAAGLLYFFRQRRRGAAEAAAAEKAAEESRRENDSMAARGINPDSFNGSTGAELNQLTQQDSNYATNSMPNTPVNPHGPLDSYGAPTMSGMPGSTMAVGAGAAAGAGMAAGGAYAAQSISRKPPPGGDSFNERYASPAPTGMSTNNHMYQNSGMGSPGPYNNAGYGANPHSPMGGIPQHNGAPLSNGGMASPGPYDNVGYGANPHSPTGGMPQHNGAPIPNGGMASPGPYDNVGYGANPHSPTGGMPQHNGAPIPNGGFGGPGGYERVASPASNVGYGHQNYGNYAPDLSSPYSEGYPSSVPPAYGGGYGQTADGSIPLQNRKPTLPHMGNGGGFH